MPTGIEIVGTPGTITGTISANRIAIGAGLDQIGNSNILKNGNDYRIDDTYNITSQDGAVIIDFGSGAYWEASADDGGGQQGKVTINPALINIGIGVDGSVNVEADNSYIFASTAGGKYGLFIIADTPAIAPGQPYIQIATPYTVISHPTLINFDAPEYNYTNLTNYANNAAAVAGGLLTGSLYYTNVAGDGVLKVVI